MEPGVTATRPHQTNGEPSPKVAGFFAPGAIPQLVGNHIPREASKSNLVFSL